MERDKKSSQKESQKSNGNGLAYFWCITRYVEEEVYRWIVLKTDKTKVELDAGVWAWRSHLMANINWSIKDTAGLVTGDLLRQRNVSNAKNEGLVT